jgi:hypothetical protein
VEPGLCGQNEAAGRGGGTAAVPGGGLAPATAPYVELGFRGLGWRWRGYSGEVPGYRGAHGGGDGWWRGSGAASATGRAGGGRSVGRRKDSWRGGQAGGGGHCDEEENGVLTRGRRRGHAIGHTIR